jgi:hypothetical protein
MAEQKRNLLKLGGFVGTDGRITAKVARSNILQATFRASGFHHAQMTFGLNPLFPMRSALLMGRNTGPMVTPAALIQLFTAALTQVGNSPHMATLPYHIGDHPMLFALLEAFQPPTRLPLPFEARIPAEQQP